MQRVWNLMCTFIGPFDLAYRKTFVITAYYVATIHTIRKGLCSWSQRQCHKPIIKKMLQNCSTNVWGVQKV